MSPQSSKLVLVFNCGSSSIKFAIIDPQTSITLCNGLVQRIGQTDADMQIKYNGAKQQQTLPNIDYRSAIQTIINALCEQHPDLFANIAAVGHRVVHGSEEFTISTVIDEKTLTTIKNCVHLAPLHNPANIIGIEEARKALPKLSHVAVFDTAFHQTMPPYAFVYPIPYEYYQKYKIRRYGFHGTSHRFVSSEAARRLGKKLSECAFITAHLGNGCSAAAILNGKSIDTTMGLTPLEGLMMGTRSGDVDPGLHAFLADNLGLDVHKITEILNKKSGVLGISGLNSDMRDVEEAYEKGDKQATLAVEIFCYRLAKYIGALAIPLRRIDALIFTGGIGENSPIVRGKTLNWLKILNFVIDEKHNAENGKNNNGIITTQNSTTAIVVPTNEELLIAQDTYNLALTP
jgi:acetate kinase